jgi:purine nucleoside phosphorylase
MVNQRVESWGKDRAAQRAQMAYCRLKGLGLESFLCTPGSTDQMTTGTAVAVILGTGWNKAMPWDEPPTDVPLADLPGFEALGLLEGHARVLQFGWVGGRRVMALNGRVHLNEAPCDPRVAEMVRLQIELMCWAGGLRHVILTAAVGGLSPEFSVGRFAVIDGFVTVYAPDMPLYGGEFCSPEDLLHGKHLDVAVRVVKRVNTWHPRFTPCGHVMVRGPFFEGRRYDKALLASVGAGVVGMSILPEATVIAAVRPSIGVIGLGYVTNGPHVEHSHEANQAQAATDVGKMEEILAGIIAEL